MKGIGKAETIKAKILLLSEEVRKLTWEYVEEMALDKDIKGFSVNMPSYDADVHPDEFNGWQCDWWGADPIEISGRMWDVSGCAWYETVTFTEVEEEC